MLYLYIFTHSRIVIKDNINFNLYYFQSFILTDYFKDILQFSFMRNNIYYNKKFSDVKDKLHHKLVDKKFLNLEILKNEIENE